MPTADLCEVVSKATRLVTVGYRKLSPSFTHLSTPKIILQKPVYDVLLPFGGTRESVTHI